MLTQFSKLSLDTDGRYASDSELQFINDYLESVDMRIQTYEKINANQEAILQEVDAKMHELNENNCLYKMDEHGKEVCRRDRKNAIKYTSAAMLIDDLDRLRDGLLIWLQTIVRAVGYEHFVRTHYPIIQEVIQQYLTPEEAQFILPALQIDCTILGA
ncbi:MAG: allophycocyanin [Crocosphaera sp.]|nr:allophycocyanin [Crocosphaera sp.]